MEKNKKQLQEKEIFEIMKVGGKERATDVKYLVKYIKEKEGENGFNDLVKELKKYNFTLPDVDKLNSMEWIPRFITRVFLIGAIYFFNWTKEEIFEMGREAAISFNTIKFFLRWFSSPKNTITMAIRGWNKYFTEGKSSLIEFDKNNKQCIFEIKDFDIRPIVVVYFEGAFTKVLEIATGSKRVEVKAIKNENNYHKFKGKW